MDRQEKTQPLPAAARMMWRDPAEWLRDGGYSSLRKALLSYMSGSGLGLRELAERVGLPYRTMFQLSRGSWISNEASQAVVAYLKANPVPLPRVPGKLYETAATREMDRLLAYINRGRWGTLYGPAGAQKTFLLEYRTAEAARKKDELNLIVYIRTSPSGMSPTVLMSRIGQALGATAGQCVDQLRRSVLDTLRKRMCSVALVLDEAQHLYSRIDTIETLREFGDLTGPQVGILVAGNEDVLRLFEPRGHMHFEQWRSRVQQHTRRVLGPSREEARTMVLGEMPGASEKAIEKILDGCTVNDPLSKRKYVNVRRLFHTLRDIGEARGAN
jgi:type II secretory pathway predicted ATPase ExeA